MTTRRDRALKFLRSALLITAAVSLTIAPAMAMTWSPWRPAPGFGTGLACGTTAQGWDCDNLSGLCEQIPGQCTQGCKFDPQDATKLIEVRCSDDGGASGW